MKVWLIIGCVVFDVAIIAVGILIDLVPYFVWLQLAFVFMVIILWKGPNQDEAIKNKALRLLKYTGMGIGLIWVYLFLVFLVFLALSSSDDKITHFIGLVQHEYAIVISLITVTTGLTLFLYRANRNKD
jgi:hypothetical protein